MDNTIFSARKRFTMDKFATQTKIITPSAAKEILNTSARSVVLLCEINSNYVVVSGKINLSVVYIDENDEIKNYETDIDYSERQKANFVLSDTFARDLVDINDIYISGNEISMQFEHNMDVFGIYKCEIGLNIENVDDYIFDKKVIEYPKFIESVSDNFVVAEETESNMRNIEILSNNAQTFLTEVSCSAGKIVLDGKIAVETLFLDDGQIGKIEKEFEFKQEIQAKNSLPNMNAFCEIAVRNITITPEEKDEKLSLVYAVDLYALCYVFENSQLDLCADIFSLKNNLSTTYDYIEARTFQNKLNENKNVLIQTNVAEINDFDDIVSVFNPKVNIKSVEYQSGKIVVMVDLFATAIYKTKESFSKLNIFSEERFEFENEINFKALEPKFAAKVTSFKVKAGKELETNILIDIELLFQNEITEKYVKSYSVESEKNQNSSVIKVYVAKENQTVFDVAKILNVKPEIILDQNQVDGTFESGQKIYVYSPINLA